MRKCNLAEMKNGESQSSAICMSSRSLIAKKKIIKIHGDAFPRQKDADDKKLEFDWRMSGLFCCCFVLALGF